MNIRVCLSKGDFMRFGWFDALHHKQVWRRPALFAAILGAAAIVCFIFHARRGAVLLGCVLTAVAAGLPAAYFLSFYLSLRRQGAGLGEGKYVYTLTLYDDARGLTVDNGSEHAAWTWDQVYRVYETDTAAYLYLTPQRAYLIPYACVKAGGEKLHALLTRWVPEGR